MDKVITRSKGLGMGLAALIGPVNQVKQNLIIDPPLADNNQFNPKEIAINQLRAGKYQPRSIFKDNQLHELAISIKENGVISPIIVRLVEGAYEIIAGERRWRAAKIAGLSHVPVIIKKIDDKKALEIAIVENVQRQDLSPIEEAEALNRLIQEFAYSHEKISMVVGKSRSHVSNMLRLLKLPDEVKKMIAEDKISVGHARAIINSTINSIELANKIVAKNLSVRETEEMVRKKTEEKTVPAKSKKKYRNDYPEINELEETLTSKLGLKVNINYSPDHGGAIEVAFKNLEQLDRLIKIFNNNVF